MSGRTATFATAFVAMFGQLLSALPAVPLPMSATVPSRGLLPKFLLWNASASAPRGLYLLRPAQPLYGGELVVVLPPERLAEFATMRGYLPASVPLLKHIAALRGQTACRFASRILIDDRAVAMARERDNRGRLLPRWQGCHTLQAGEVFLLNTTISDSFDGRYFGVLPADAITARALPLWITPEP